MPITRCILNNSFTLYNLLELLAERKIHAAWTARVCSFSRPPLQPDKDMPKKERRNYDEAISRDGKVALVKWYDNRPVVMASNFVGVGTMDEVQQWNKKEARFVKGVPSRGDQALQRSNRWH